MATKNTAAEPTNPDSVNTDGRDTANSADSFLRSRENPEPSLPTGGGGGLFRQRNSSQAKKGGQKGKTRSIGRGTNIEFNPTDSPGEFNVAENRGDVGVENVIAKTASLESGKPNSSQKPGSAQRTSRRITGITGKVIKNSTGTGLINTVLSRGKTAPEEDEASSNQKSEQASESQEQTQPTPPAKPPPTRAEKVITNVGKAAGKFMMYTTPGGFIVGKLASRKRERDRAKKELEELGKKQPEDSQDKKPAIKKPPTKSEIFAKRIIKTTSLFTGGGIIYRVLPKPIKARLKKFFSPPAKGATPTVTPPETKPKTLRQFQESWNKSVIFKAILKGFDRYALFRKIRDLKVWQSRPWRKTAQLTSIPGGVKKNFVSPMVTGARGIPQKISGKKFSRFAQEEQAFSFSPTRILGGSFFRQMRSSRLGGINRRLGSSINNSPKKSLGRNLANNVKKQAVDKLKKEALKKILEEPHVLLVVGIIIAVILVLAFIVYVTMSVFIAISGGGGGGSGTGSGGNGGGSNGGGNNGGGPPSSNPIPGFTLDKAVDKTQSDYPDQITYTITYSYSPATGAALQLSGITIYDKLPANTSYVSSSGNGAYDSTSNTVSWSLSDSANTSPLTLVIAPNQDNISISNKAYAEARAVGSGVITGGDSINEIFKNSAANAGVPYALLKAIANSEGGVLSYTTDDITRFNKNSWWSGLSEDAPTLDELPEPIHTGYGYNTCAFPKSNPICPGSDVRGATQFEAATWNSVVIPRLTSTDGHVVDRRYVTDAIFGEGIFTKYEADQYDSRFHFSNNPTDWTEEQVRAMARTYCGGNPDADINQPACGNGTYDTAVWGYYQEFKAETP